MKQSRFPRPDYAPLAPYDPGRAPVTLDLSDNTNLWGPHPEARNIVQRAAPSSLARYPSVYGKELKEAVARNFDVPRENVVTGCGSDDLLDSTFRSSAQPPGRMTYPDPTFSMIRIFARMNGLEARGVPWTEALANPGLLLAQAPDLVYVCRPNNPTGTSSSKAWVLDLLGAAGPDGPLVVLDEAYADYAEDDLLREAVASERLLVLRTFSKLYGLAGLRVGFGVGPAELVAEVEKARGPYKVNGLAERAAVAALDDTSGWAARIATETVENRKRLGRELESRGLNPLPSQANFLLIPTGSGKGEAVEGFPGISARELNDRLRCSGMAARPFTNLDAIGDALRVTIGPWEQMVRFLEALDTALSMGGRSRRSE